MSSVSNDQPLSALAASLMENDVSPSPMRSQKHAHDSCHGGWWVFVFYFLVIALILYFVFFALRPSFVLDNNCDSRSASSEEFGEREINNGKLLGSAIVVALILIFIFWLFSYALNAVY